LTLSKNYCQDRAMEWGFLTESEQSHRVRQVERARRALHEAGPSAPVEEFNEPGEEPA
jgi:hypothetical protein